MPTILTIKLFPHPSRGIVATVYDNAGSKIHESVDARAHNALDIAETWCRAQHSDAEVRVQWTNVIPKGWTIEA